MWTTEQNQSDLCDARSLLPTIVQVVEFYRSMDVIFLAFTGNPINVVE